MPQVVESLYGQDLDSGHHGSGFPLPPSRKRLLEEHLKKTAAAESKDGEKPAAQPEDGASEGSDTHEEITYNPEEAAYSEHCWNINNLPRCKVNPLSFQIMVTVSRRPASNRRTSTGGFSPLTPRWLPVAKLPGESPAQHSTTMATKPLSLP